MLIFFNQIMFASYLFKTLPFQEVDIIFFFYLISNRSITLSFCVTGGSLQLGHHWIHWIHLAGSGLMPVGNSVGGTKMGTLGN